jgi:hypothetical protein
VVPKIHLVYNKLAQSNVDSFNGFFYFLPHFCALQKLVLFSSLTGNDGMF